MKNINENRKDYKIPKGWKSIRIKESGKVYSGGTPDTNNTNFWNGNIIWITPTDITSLKNKYILNSKRNISEIGLKNCSANLLPINSLVVCTRATIGLCAITKTELATNQGFKNIIFNPNFNVLYFYYYILFSKNKLIRLGCGSTFLEISKKDFENCIIQLPPIPEQKKIAEILSAWDSAIEQIQKLIDAKKRLKKGLMQKLLTGKIRFPEFVPRNTQKTRNEENKLPQGWKKVKLENLAKIRRGASPRPISDTKWFADGGRGWIRISDATKSKIYLTKTTQYLSKQGAEKSVKVEPGELILSICATIGVPIIVNIPACIHDGFVIIKDYEKQIDRFFLFYFLSSITDKLSGKGQPGTQKNLNISIVGNILLNFPELCEQNKIASILSSCDSEIEFLEKEEKVLSEQKKGLMQKLLTGTIRTITTKDTKNTKKTINKKC